MSIINNMPSKGGMTINGDIKEYYVAAGETVNAGDFVELKNGIASNGAFSRLVPYGQALTTSSGYSSVSVNARYYAIDENRVLCHYDDVNLALISYSGGSFSKIATATLSSSHFPENCIYYSNGMRWENDDSGNARVILFGVHANEPYFCAVVITVGTDNTISIGSYNRITCAGDYCRETNVCKTSDNRIFLNYYDYSGEGFLYRFLTIDGTTTSWTDAVSSPFQVSTDWSESFVMKNGTLLFRSSTKIYPITVNGNTITVGTYITFPVNFNSMASYKTASQENEIDLVGIYLNGSNDDSSYPLKYYIINFISDLTFTVSEITTLSDSWYTSSNGSVSFTVVPMDINKVILTTNKWSSRYNSEYYNNFSVFVCHISEGKTVCLEQVENYGDKYFCMPLCLATSSSRLFVGSVYRQSTSYYLTEGLLQIPNYERQVALPSTEIVYGLAKTSGTGGNETGHKDKIEVYFPNITE